MESKGKLVPKNERILRAAEAVFSKKGYRQATLDEIVKIADTGKGTVYKYFNK
ncbi:transcriptional regulator, TetR family [Acidaminococcus sp. BV3L6]|nr:transcriptional regulator, TetR family [Acidaminococcus sp. BV3L6]